MQYFFRVMIVVDKSSIKGNNVNVNELIVIDYGAAILWDDVCAVAPEDTSRCVHFSLL